MVEKRDARWDGFVNVIGKAMGQELGEDSDDVMKILNERGNTKRLTKDTLVIAQKRNGFTVFALVNALSRNLDKLANAGDRSEADAKAFALLALAAQRSFRRRNVAGEKFKRPRTAGPLSIADSDLRFAGMAGHAGGCHETEQLLTS